jgi:hypothetical protein
MSQLRQHNVHAWREAFLDSLQKSGRIPRRSFRWESYERVA